MKKPTRVEMKKRRKRILFRLVLLLTLLTITVTYAFKSDFFNIESIKVEGNTKISDEQIVNSSRINIGENIFRIKKSQSENGIKYLPYIKEVEVYKSFPRTISIKVEERKPVIQVKALSSYILIDNEGYVLEIVDERVEDLTSFIGFDINNAKPGEQISKSEQNLNIFDFIDEEEILNILNKISYVNYIYDIKEINIELFNGIGVAFGTLDNVKYKLRVLDKLLIDIEKKQLPCKMIIMNKGDNPIVVTENY